MEKVILRVEISPKETDIEEVLDWLETENDYVNYGLGFYNNKNVILSSFNQNKVFTLKTGDKNIGLVVWSDIEEEIVDIDIFTIHPNFRNRGFGRFFYNSVLRHFKKLNYKVLKFLYNNQIQVNDEYYIVLSQQEIADMVQFSKLKTNGIMQELREKGFIANYENKRRKYVITDIGYKVIELMSKNR